MDITALFNLTYGLYIVGAMDGELPVGCVINTCFQVTSENPILAISMNKNNYTLEVIKKTKKFSLSILDEQTDPSTIGVFGFQSSRTADKYEDYGYTMFGDVPVVNGKFAGRLSLELLSMADNETHMVVFARLVDTIKEEGTPMTYSYYHKVVKGKAPKSAPTYRANEEVEEVKEEAKPEKKLNRYQCDVCGYVAEVEGELPDDFTCPLCKMDRSHFHLI